MAAAQTCQHSVARHQAWHSAPKPTPGNAQHSFRLAAAQTTEHSRVGPCTPSAAAALGPAPAPANRKGRKRHTLAICSVHVISPHPLVVVLLSALHTTGQWSPSFTTNTTAQQHPSGMPSGMNSAPIKSHRTQQKGASKARGQGIIRTCSCCTAAAVAAGCCTSSRGSDAAMAATEAGV